MLCNKHQRRIDVLGLVFKPDLVLVSNPDSSFGSDK